MNHEFIHELPLPDFPKTVAPLGPWTKLYEGSHKIIFFYVDKKFVIFANTPADSFCHLICSVLLPTFPALNGHADDR